MKRAPLLLLLAPGCVQPQSQICGGVVVDTSQHTNAAVLSWSTDDAGTSYVEYDVDGETFQRSGGKTATTDHQVALFGLPALADIAWRAITEIDGAEITCEGELTTGNLPAGLPDVEVTIYDEDRVSSERYMLGVVMGTDASWPFIIDRQGNWVWHWEGELENSVQAELAWDGQGILINSFAFDRGEDRGYVYQIDLLGGTTAQYTTPGGHHIFERLDEGFAYPSVDIEDWYNPSIGAIEQVAGDAIMELVDGQSTEVFNFWDWQEPTLNDYWDTIFYPNARDWTHVNSIDYSAAYDSYLVSSPTMNTVLEIDRSSGAVLAEYPSSEWSFTDPDTSFVYQHDVHWTDEGTMLAISHTDEGTKLVEYAVDDARGELSRVWSYGDDLGVKGHVLGQSQRLENGNTMVNFGGAGLLQEVTPDGEVVWEVRTGLGTWLGNGQMIHSIYEADGG